MRDTTRIMREDAERRLLREIAETRALNGNARNRDFVIENEDAPGWRNPDLAKVNGIHLMPTPRRAYVDARRTFDKPRTRCVGVAPGTDSKVPTFRRILADGTESVETVASLRKHSTRAPRSQTTTAVDNRPEVLRYNVGNIGNVE